MAMTNGKNAPIEPSLALARSMLERWAVVDARTAAGRALTEASAWGDARAVLTARILAARAALLTSVVAPAELKLEGDAFGEDAELAAAKRRYLVEAAIAKGEPTDGAAQLSAQSLFDDAAAVVLAEAHRLSQPGASARRILRAGAVGSGWGPWEQLALSIEAEANGRSGIETVERVIEERAASGQLAPL